MPTNKITDQEGVAEDSSLALENRALAAELARVRAHLAEMSKLEKANIRMLGDLKKSEARYRDIVEDQMDLICRCKPDLTLTFVNRAFSRYYDKPAGWFVGRSIMPLMSEQTQQTYRKCIDSLSPEHPVDSRVYRDALPDGTVFWQHWINRALYNSAGILVEYLGVGRDITELQEVSQALEQKNVALKEILEQIGREKEQIKQDVVANIDELLLPICRKMSSEGPETTQRYLELLERTLDGMASSFGRKITIPSLRLTPREVEICTMIKAGFISKEIAEMLHVSSKAIDFHRTNIRKKLDLTNQKVNLATFLHSLDAD